ncbi:MAG: DUF5456 family protein [Parabacteroides sp.]|nr:DUF5456 family protein [Parabacteroides sp.]
MTAYSLYELAGMLKIGLWQGGEVEKVGYIGAPVSCTPTAKSYGLQGVYISYDTMLESCEGSAQGGGCELLISQYQPYTGTYALYKLESHLRDRDLLLSRLHAILTDQRNPYVWSYNLSESNVYAIKRRYGNTYSSIRGGAIATPRGSKRFGR